MKEKKVTWKYRNLRTHFVLYSCKRLLITLKKQLHKYEKDYMKNAIPKYSGLTLL